MTRKTVQALVTEVPALFVDNIAGLITPAIARGVLLDIIDSIAPLTAMVAGVNPGGLVVPLTATFTKLPASFFTSVVNGNTAVIEARTTPFGDVKVFTGIGRLHANFDVTLSAGNGIEFEFTLAKNGVVEPFTVVVTGRGAANPISASFTWLFPTIAANDVVDIWARATAGPANITLTVAAVKALLMPAYV